jgi:aryl-alcohol dehydrogenase-like predicted oxidoreductase
MLRRTLGKAGLEVSVLGFGCAKLTAQPRHEALSVLQAAYEQGITHFDVARLYGLGWAEGVLGEFLRGKRDRITVTTKFGLKPPGGIVKHRRMVSAAKAALSGFPPLVRLLRKRVQQRVQSGKFTPEDASRSLETSLRELGTDYVDMLLLHECDLTEAAEETLMHFLKSQIVRGTVRCVGIGSDFSKLETDLSRVPPLYQVIQFNHNAQTRNLPRLSGRQDRTLSTHTVFGPVAALTEAIRTQPQAARDFAKEIGIDPLDTKAIGSLLLHYSLQTNTDGIVLFSTTDSGRVRANAQDAASARYDPSQIARFVDFVDAMLATEEPGHVY